MYTYIHVHICLHMPTYLSTNLLTYLYIHGCMDLLTDLSRYLYVCIHIHSCEPLAAARISCSYSRSWHGAETEAEANNECTRCPGSTACACAQGAAAPEGLSFSRPARGCLPTKVTTRAICGCCAPRTPFYTDVSVVFALSGVSRVSEAKRSMHTYMQT